MDAMGFDIITGSAAAKNVVTLGATGLMIDDSLHVDSMSDFSSWAPTDDGRIKPDIVTLGTMIDASVYENDGGYLIDEPSSQGTSYAAAAGVLLLQEYYYSLNNEYMKASMLKALLLHSAEDGPSGSAPDAKFGWGILNLERAANIIKQSSIPNGNAKMVMIDTNPDNDESDEIIFNFDFDSDDARVSLDWVDNYNSAIPQYHIFEISFFKFY